MTDRLTNRQTWDEYKSFFRWNTCKHLNLLIQKVLQKVILSNYNTYVLRGNSRQNKRLVSVVRTFIWHCEILRRKLNALCMQICVLSNIYNYWRYHENNDYAWCNQNIETVVYFLESVVSLCEDNNIFCLLQTTL